jgi:hypothetical protein
VWARAEAVINAPVDAVWAKLSDVAAWDTNLEPGVRRIRLEAGVTVDSRFFRTVKGARLRARFAVVDPERELAWSGVSLGVKVVHRFVLASRGPSQTFVVVEESMAGPPLAAAFSSRQLREVLRQSLETLRRASEVASGNVRTVGSDLPLLDRLDG